MRQASYKRKTKETDIDININLDGTSRCNIQTGIGFFNHMLELLVFHSMMDVEILCKGDIDVDDHHSIEDIGIALGKCIKDALGDKKGIRRYGNFYMPMDESLANVCIDISSRSYLVFNCDFKADSIGTMSIQMIEEFFRAVAFSLGATLHINLMYGKNDHHKAEAIFKGFARALKEAIYIDSALDGRIESSKGCL